MRCDLHLHTTCSDGALAPEALAEAARAAGLGLIAVTDHDTTAGVARARAAAAAGLEVLAGVELTCTRDGEDLHLLGYGIATAHPRMVAWQETVGARRQARVGEIVDRLRALGVAIGVEDVRLPPGNRTAGRPHIAAALVRLGRVRTVQDAFDRWLADGGPAAVPAAGPSVEQGIAVVHETGGLAVWAHPSLEDAAAFAELRDAGLDGAEVWRPGLPPAASAHLEGAARRANLLLSGGSDWHGGTPPLGTWYLSARRVEPLLACLRSSNG